MIMFKMFYCNFEFGYALDTNSSYNFVFACSCTGYMSLEYATFGQLNTKLDVYSLGILLLEIVSGRKNMFDSTSQMEKNHLVKWVYAILTCFQIFYAISNSNNLDRNIFRSFFYF